MAYQMGEAIVTFGASNDMQLKWKSFQTLLIKSGGPKLKVSTKDYQKIN